MDSESENAAAHRAVTGERSVESLHRVQLQDLQPTALIEDLFRQPLVFCSDERRQVFEGISSLLSPL